MSNLYYLYQVLQLASGRTSVNGNVCFQIGTTAGNIGTLEQSYNHDLIDNISNMY